MISQNLEAAEILMMVIRHDVFLKDSSLSATITGIDEDLIKRIFTILRVISSGFPINTEAFDKYASDTTKLYLQLYPWYMPCQQAFAKYLYMDQK